jgi:hypothetical protein
MNREMYDRLLGKAVAALTAAARLTTTQSHPDGPTTEIPADWAEFVTLALAGAAANIGGIETILAGRPGSWEAGGVRQLLEATVGCDAEGLWRHRTEPLHVTVYAREAFEDAGMEASYEAAETELDRRLTAVPEDSTAADAVNALWTRLLDQWKDDLVRYGAGVAAAVAAQAADLGFGAPVTVTVDIDTNRIGERPSTWIDDILVDPAAAEVPLPGGDVLARAADPTPPADDPDPGTGGPPAADAGTSVTNDTPLDPKIRQSLGDTPPHRRRRP